MKKICSLFLSTLLIFSCGNEIKNKDAKVEVEQGTEVPTSDQSTASNVEIKKEVLEEVPPFTLESLLGFWVGKFVPARGNEEKTLYVDDGFAWDRSNKITISIDKITDNLVVGHSVVAGNDRPFEGTVEQVGSHRYAFKLKEPGDDKYDGEFSFTFFEHEDKIQGTWTAYKNIEIKNRKYLLEQRKFTYDPDIMLEDSKRYMDWNKKIETKQRLDFDGDVEEWIANEFSTATNLIYKINASNKLLPKSTVENLLKGDITIIRNSIYARHGYSFKNRPLRVFFDAQPWYIPVHSNIKNDFTDIEKQNIKLLLKYEKNAAEYYDSFGRG